MRDDVGKGKTCHHLVELTEEGQVGDGSGGRYIGSGTGSGSTRV